MTRIVIIAALLIGTMVHADAKQRHQIMKRENDSGVTVYNRESANPAIGWHTENGMRVCHYDCDNPEIPAPAPDATTSISWVCRCANA